MDSPKSFRIVLCIVVAKSYVLVRIELVEITVGFYMHITYGRDRLNHGQRICNSILLSVVLDLSGLVEACTLSEGQKSKENGGGGKQSKIGNFT